MTLPLGKSDQLPVSLARRLARSKHRNSQRRFIADTPRVISEAFEAGADVIALLATPRGVEVHHSIIDSAKRAGIETVEVSERELAAAATTKTPQGILAIVDFVDCPLDEAISADPVAVLAGLRDPGNVGTLIRAADGAGAGGVLTLSESADIYNPKAVRASAGSLFRIPVARGVEAGLAVEGLRSSGYTIVGADPDGEEDIRHFDFAKKIAVVVGNEAAGLPPELDLAIDARISIPMPREGQSLNAAVAGALLLFEITRSRGGPRDLARVVSILSHDLRSPLTSVKGFASTLERRWNELDGDLKREMITQIGTAAGKLTGAIAELVDVARLQTGEIRFAPIQFSARKEAKDVCDEIAVRYSHVEWEIDLGEDEFETYADRDRFRQAIGVIVENAATHGADRVSVRLESDRQITAFSVTDNGDGMTEEHLELCMTGVLEGRKRGVQPAGTGLALYVVAAIAARQGGRLEGASMVGSGSTFRLELPSAGPVGG